MVTREEDAVRRLIVCDTHDNVLFFTDRGRVFQSRAYDVPDAKRQAKGIPLVNVIEMRARRAGHGGRRRSATTTRTSW